MSAGGWGWGAPKSHCCLGHSCWGMCKDLMLNQISSKSAKSGLLNPQVWQWAYSFQLRYDAGADLWLKVPEIPKAANRSGVCENCNGGPRG